MDNRKIAIYSRKSKFTGKGESIENQVAFCKARVRSQFPDVTEDDLLIFEDEGFSGGNLNRPQFKEMLKLIKADKIKAVFSYRLDRISRSVVDFANLYEILNEHNVAYVSATECYETSTPLGRAMMSIATVFAQLERETIAERIRDNMLALAKTGRWLGGVTPTGYKSVPTVGSVTVDGKERKAYKLELIPEEAETVRLIFAKFLTCHSLTGVETDLLQKGIKTKNGREYTRFSVKAILQNPVYMTADKAAWDYFRERQVDICGKESDFSGKYGIMAYNKTLQKEGKPTHLRDRKEWIVATGKHSPLISSTDWIKAQELLEQNSSKAYRKPKSHRALLSGLLYCADCGSFMRPKTSTRLNADGEKVFPYICEKKEKSHSHNCRMKNVNGNLLDKAVCEEIKKLGEDCDAFITGLLDASKRVTENTDEYETQMEILQKTLAENDKQIKNLVSALAQSEQAATGYINRQISELHGKNEEIRERLQTLEAVSKDRVLTKEDFKALKTLLSSFAGAFDNMSIEEKRTALRTFVKRIEWDGENAHVYLFGDEDISIKGGEMRTLCKDSK